MFLDEFWEQDNQCGWQTMTKEGRVQDDSKEGGESDHGEPQFNFDDQEDLLESLKQGAIQSALYFFKNDSGCSLDNETTIYTLFPLICILWEIRMGESWRLLSSSWQGMVWSQTRISAADVGKHCQIWNTLPGELRVLENAIAMCGDIGGGVGGRSDSMSGPPVHYFI